MVKTGSRRGRRIRESRGDRIVDAIVMVIILLVFIMWFFPLLYVALASVTPYVDVVRGGLLILPSSPTFEGYRYLFRATAMLKSFSNTLIITLVGTTISMALSVLLAYPLAKKDLPGRGMIAKLLIFTMYFGGGLIPTYLVVRQLGILNSLWAMIIPGCVSTYNMLLIRSYFANMPEEITEAALVDGCGPMKTLLRIALPLALPVIMSVMLFYMVSYWNTYYAYYYYCYDTNLRPLQVVLMDLIKQATGDSEADEYIPTITVQMSAVVFTCVPIIMVYPFIQRYFTQGIMLGAVKG